MSCQTKTVRCILHIFNVIMILVGVFIIFDVSSSINDLPGAYIGYMYFFGSISLLFGLLGFVGICRDNVCIMKVYAVIILVSIITQIVGICYSNKFEESIREKVINNVKIQWHEEIKHPGAMDEMQMEYECCGHDSPKDYNNTLHRPMIPHSCYMDNDGTTLFEEGCLIQVQNSIVDAFVSDIVDWVIIGLTAILFGFALFLTRHFMNKKRRGNYKN